MATQKGIDNKSSKFRSISEIMSIPSYKAKLTNLVDEAVECKTKIETQKQNIKVLRETALDELGLKPELFNNYVNMMFNNDYTARLDKVEELHSLITSVIQSVDKQLEHDNDD